VLADLSEETDEEERTDGHRTVNGKITAAYGILSITN
jgi:hypothetical protein